MPHWIRSDWILLVIGAIAVLWFVMITKNGQAEQITAEEEFMQEDFGDSYSEKQLMKAVGLAKVAAEKLKNSQAEIARLKDELARTPSVVTTTPKPAHRCQQHSHFVPTCSTCQVWKARHPCEKCGDRCAVWAYGGACGCSCHSKYDFQSLDTFKLKLRINQLMEEKQKWQDMLKIQKRWLAEHHRRWHRPTMPPATTAAPTPEPTFPPPPTTAAPPPRPIVRPIIIKKQKRYRRKPWWFTRPPMPWRWHTHPPTTTPTPAPPTTPARPVVIRKKCRHRKRRPFPFPPGPFSHVCPDGTSNCWPWPTPPPATACPVTTTIPPTTTTLPPTTTTTLPPTTTTTTMTTTFAPTTTTTRTTTPGTTTRLPASPVTPTGGWKIFKWAGKYMAIRQSNDFNIECLGKETGQCLFASTVRECATNIFRYGGPGKGKTLKCGNDHKAVHGSSGYETGLHWCFLGKKNLSGENLNLAGIQGGDFQCMLYGGRYMPVRMSANQQDPECLTGGVQPPSCQWQATPEACRFVIQKWTKNNEVPPTRRCGDPNTVLDDGRQLSLAGGRAWGYENQEHWCSLARNGVDGAVDGKNVAPLPSTVKPNMNFVPMKVDTNLYYGVRLNADANTPECLGSTTVNGCASSTTEEGMRQLINTTSKAPYFHKKCDTKSMNTPGHWCDRAKQRLFGYDWRVLEAEPKRFIAVRKDKQQKVECLSSNGSTCVWTESEAKMQSVISSMGLYGLSSTCEASNRPWCGKAKSALELEESPAWVRDITSKESFATETFSPEAFDGFTVSGIDYGNQATTSSGFEGFAAPAKKWAWTPLGPQNVAAKKAPTTTRKVVTTKKAASTKKAVTTRRPTTVKAAATKKAVITTRRPTVRALTATTKRAVATTTARAAAPVAVATVKKIQPADAIPLVATKAASVTSRPTSRALVVPKAVGTVATTATRAVTNPLLGRTTTPAKAKTVVAAPAPTVAALAKQAANVLKVAAAPITTRITTKVVAKAPAPPVAAKVAAPKAVAPAAPKVAAATKKKLAAFTEAFYDLE